MRAALILLATITIPAAATAQFTLQTSNTAADLRGIHNVGNGVAWASGTNGTVLRTEDGGYVWQSCSMPPGAEKLDFRGIQAFDSNTAIVMSSGPGDQSRLYKTTDGCHSWKLLFTNPDKDGFWDAIAFSKDPQRGFILGDPVAGRFILFFTLDNGAHWARVIAAELAATHADTSAFAASNSALTLNDGGLPTFGTGGPDGPWLYLPDSTCTMLTAEQHPAECPERFLRFERVKLPMPASSASAGVFSIATNRTTEFGAAQLVAVGGDYAHPETPGGAAILFAVASSVTLGVASSTTPPHGYRSSVAYDPSTKTWITVGPNGTDISTDDGRNWRPVHPNPALHESPDADRNWNALSLPFVVGPKGRIGKLDESSLKP